MSYPNDRRDTFRISVASRPPNANALFPARCLKNLALAASETPCWIGKRRMRVRRVRVRADRCSRLDERAFLTS